MQKFPAFYGTRRFITEFTSFFHLSLAQTRAIQSMAPSHFLNIHFHIFSHLRLRLPSGLFTSGLPTKTLWAHLQPPHTCHMSHPSHSSWFDDPNNVWWWVQIIKLLDMQSSPLPYYLLSLGPILEHPQPVFFAQFEHPSFTPIHNRQNYSFVYLDLHIFG